MRRGTGGSRTDRTTHSTTTVGNISLVLREEGGEGGGGGREGGRFMYIYTHGVTKTDIEESTCSCTHVYARVVEDGCTHSLNPVTRTKCVNLM